jgi:hypothetical protein
MIGASGKKNPKAGYGSHNERLEGQKRRTFDQDPHNATVEEFIEGEPFGLQNRPWCGS